MTYSMLGLYSLEKQNADDFRLNFEIPDNCYYNFNTSGSKYTIEIHLNPGQTTPSTNMVSQSEIVSLVANELSTEFEQYVKVGTVIKKPTIVTSEG